MTRTKLAELLRLYRSVREIGTRDLAAEIGMSPATLNRIEHGHTMDADTLMKIFNWLVARG